MVHRLLCLVLMVNMVAHWLRLDFVVPEGKFATVSWKGIYVQQRKQLVSERWRIFVDTLEGVKASWTGPI